MRTKKRDRCLELSNQIINLINSDDRFDDKDGINDIETNLYYSKDIGNYYYRCRIIIFYKRKLDSILVLSSGKHDIIGALKSLLYRVRRELRLVN